MTKSPAIANIKNNDQVEDFFCMLEKSFFEPPTDQMRNAICELKESFLELPAEQMENAICKLKEFLLELPAKQIKNTTKYKSKKSLSKSSKDNEKAIDNNFTISEQKASFFKNNDQFIDIDNIDSFSNQGTSLRDFHEKNNAQMIDFANCKLPVFYKNTGIIQEHNWTRSKASIFDVSHMVQIEVEQNNAMAILEKITPSYFKEHPLNIPKYTALLNKDGFIIDDWIVTKTSETSFYAVINAGRSWEKTRYLANFYNKIKIINDALVAIQGPEALDVVAKNVKNFSLEKRFSMGKFEWGGAEIYISRLGYTGEDGVEVRINRELVEKFCVDLLKDPRVKLAGLGARDSLRLEAGYPLCGNDLYPTEISDLSWMRQPYQPRESFITPVEANLGWLVKNFSCFGGHELKRQKEEGPEMQRIGIKLDINTRRIPRNKNSIADSNGRIIGNITSSGFIPSKNFIVAHAYIKKPFQIGDKVFILNESYKDINFIVPNIDDCKFSEGTISNLSFL